jgi:hydrogenase maturation factor HypF (carbamoyltransferase family)
VAFGELPSAVDATSEAAVERLRLRNAATRSRRRHGAIAEQAEALAEVGGAERRLLAPERPVVVAPPGDAGLPTAVAPGRLGRGDFAHPAHHLLLDLADAR